MQKSVTEFSSTCGKAKIYVENDMAIGIFHDFLMEMKGLMVDKMVANQKAELEEAAAQKQQDIESDSCSTQEYA